MREKGSGQFIAKLLTQLLERASTYTVIHMLTAQQRLVLLLEVLLGHAPLRGGRTRDYPFSVDRLNACELALLLKNRPWSVVPLSKAPDLGLTEHPGIPISTLDLLVALQLLVAVRLGDKASLEKEVESSQLITWLLSKLLADNPDGADSILGLLGVPWDKQPRERGSNEFPLLPKLALKLAAASYLQDDPVFGVDHIAHTNESELQKVLDRVCRILNVKPSEQSFLRSPSLGVLGLQSKKVQSLLDLCHRVHVQRGASFWVSQNMARIRDMLIKEPAQETHSSLDTCTRVVMLDNDAKSVLAMPIQLSHLSSNACPRVVMLDNDAKTVLVMPKQSLDSKAIRALVLSRLYQDGNVSREWIAGNFPRLLPYWEAAIQNNDEMQGCIPEVELQFTHSVSPLELALDGRIDFDEPPLSLKSRLGKERIAQESDPSLLQTDLGGLPCSGVRGRTRLRQAEAIPSWMHSHKGEGYSLAGVAYSLAAITYARVTSQSIANHVGECVKRTVRPLDKQKELADSGKTTSDLPTQLLLMKIDGEGVGQQFLQSSSLRRPGLSIALESVMREAWLEGLIEILRQFPRLNVVPALLVYFGGDDLLFLLNQNHLEAFISGFERGLQLNSSALADLKFTFACVEVPEESDADELGQTSMAAVELINDALEAAKEIRRTHVKTFPSESPNVLDWYDGNLLRGLLRWRAN